MPRRKPRAKVAVKTLEAFRKQLAAQHAATEDSTTNSAPSQQPSMSDDDTDAFINVSDSDSDASFEELDACSDSSDSDWSDTGTDDGSGASELDEDELEKEATFLFFRKKLQDGLVRVLERERAKRGETNRPAHYTGNAASTQRKQRAQGRKEMAKGTKSIADIFPVLGKRRRSPGPAAASSRIVQPPHHVIELMSSDNESIELPQRPLPTRTRAKRPMVVESDSEDDDIAEPICHLPPPSRVLYGPPTLRTGREQIHRPATDTAYDANMDWASGGEEDGEEVWGTVPLPTAVPPLHIASYSCCNAHALLSAQPDTRPAKQVCTDLGPVPAVVQLQAPLQLPSPKPSPEPAQPQPWKDHEGLRKAQKDLKDLSKNQRLDVFFRRRIETMLATLNLFFDTDLKLTIRAASRLATKAVNRGKTHALQLRRWIYNYMNSGALPTHRYGTFTTSALGDEDFAQAIHLYLLEISGEGRYIRAADVVKFVSSPDMQHFLGGKVTISERTALRWLRAMEWRYGSSTKGMYIDGHERADVVLYRKEFLERWLHYEKRMRLYDRNFEVVKDPALVMQPGRVERRLILYTHDESTFYANDRRKTKWTHKDEPKKPCHHIFVRTCAHCAHACAQCLKSVLRQ